MTSARVCRSCSAPLEQSFCDVATAPLSNDFLRESDLARGERYYPLHAFVCTACFLVQLEEFEPPERIFSDTYAYFSSYSESWLAHARAYVGHVTERFGLGRDSLVVEIASNDGYLLQYFPERGVPVLGIEPAENCARVARDKGVTTLTRFFGVALAEELVAEGRQADLLVGNNVLAHVPDLNDFVAGLRIALKPTGTITMEFPHLLRLMDEVQFDTIYHEHFSYLSLLTVERIFQKHGLAVVDVAELSTHGGSLRIYATHAARGVPTSASVEELRALERARGLDTLAPYAAFQPKVHECKRSLLRFLIDAKEAGKSVAAYGAPAKGNTLLNYCGVRSDMIAYTVDRSPHKQGLFLPGTRIPILAPERLEETRPDYIVLLPWNLREELMTQLSYARSWGARFVTPVPVIKVWE